MKYDLKQTQWIGILQKLDLLEMQRAHNLTLTLRSVRVLFCKKTAVKNQLNVMQ